MSDSLRDRLLKVQSVARGGAYAAQVLYRTGVLGALTPSGVAAFARAARGQKPGPQLAFVLHAVNKPDKLCLVDAGSGRRLTYGEFDREATRLATGLLELGARPGDRIAVMLRNSAEYLLTQSAMLRSGLVGAQVGYRLKGKEIAHILENAEPVAMIAHRDYLPFIDEARALTGNRLGADKIVVVGSSRAGETPGVRFEDVLRGDGRALRGGDTTQGGVMIYTSGTTGKPKGARRSLHQTGLAAVGDMMDQVGMHHDDRHLVVCPLYHSAAPAFSSMMFSLGATVVVTDHFEPEPILDLIARERITGTFMVPTMLSRLAALDPARRKRYDTSSLRWVLVGAAALPTETARRFQEAFGDILWNFYGATETGLVTLAGPRDHTARPGTIGRLLRGNEVRFLDESGAQVAAGDVGELYARNGMLIAGYHANAEATAKAMRDGFFSVGDMGRVDADGFHYLAERKSDMVISGGVNIYPREIEDHLYSHPGILDVAVVGVPDPEWGESLKAFVVLRPGCSLTADEVRAYCQQSLADYKRPRHVEFLAELPRNPTGKVLKRELRAR